MALRNQPYLPLYVNDFLSDEKLRQCSPASYGVYILLMCLMHKSDEYGKILLKQKFKQNPKQILNFACMFARDMPFDVAEIEAGLQELIEENVLTLDGDYLTQKRMVKDGNLSDKRAFAGQRGGKTTTTNKNFACDFAQAKIQANAINEIEIINESDIEVIKDTSKNDRDKAFDAFWSSYPRKSGKAAARKAFDKVPRSVWDKLVPAVEAQKRSEQWQKENGQYIPLPTTWLNQGRWDDELPEAKSSKQQTSAPIDWSTA